MSLSNEELERYSRHLILKEIGYKGQKKLSESKVLIIGAGGLGVPAEMYLAADGIREEVYEEFRKIGFLYVTLDLKGYRLGSMNATLQLIKEAAAGGASRYIAGAFRLLRKMY